MDVDVMPYDGAAYDSLLGVLNVDYYNSNILDSDVYRHEDSPLADPANPHHVDISNNSGGRFGLDRGSFQLTTDYRIGWVSSTAWCNYTRTIPKGDYNVWAALSYGDTNANQLRATLALVTSDPTKPNQTTQPLGAFSGTGSGGWGRNELVPMKDTTGKIATVSMAGVQTLRLTMDSGDYDYFLLVPATQTEVTIPKFSKVGVTGSSITIEWTGGGTLIASDTVNGTYSAVAGNPASPATVPASGKAKFFRIQK
jgi:hypothetical protein